MKQKLLLTFPAEATGHTITYELITKYQLEVNILRASIDFNAQGFLLIEVIGDISSRKEALDFLLENNVEVREINAAILINEEKCINCGACTAACTVGALYMDNNWCLSFDNEKCLDCKTCVVACPKRAIEAVL